MDALAVLPTRDKDLLAQVEVLMLFHITLQSGGPRRVPTTACERAAQGWLTVDVYGARATDDAGKTVLEDTRFEVGGEDIEHLLPDNIVQQIIHYVLTE